MRALLPGHARLVWRAPPGRLALTFDDGPDPEGTPAVLDALDAVGAAATFFLLTDKARAHPLLVARVVGAGHEVALHGDRHERVDREDVAVLAGRLHDAKAELEDLSGAPVRHHRPPFGRLSGRVLRAAAAAELNVVLWTHDPEDYRPSPPGEVDARLASALRSRAVVVLHDGADTFPGQALVTAAALRSALPALAVSGIRPAVCTEL